MCAFVAKINTLQVRSTLLLRLESVSTQLSLSALDLWNSLLQVGGASSTLLITLLGDTLNTSTSYTSTLHDTPAAADNDVIAMGQQQQQHASESTEGATVAHKLPVKLTVSESTAAVTACVAVTQKLLSSFCTDFVDSPIHPAVVRAHKVSQYIWYTLSYMQTHVHAYSLHDSCTPQLACLHASMCVKLRCSSRTVDNNLRHNTYRLYVCVLTYMYHLSRSSHH
jgi:hypothetical protein